MSWARIVKVVAGACPFVLAAALVVGLSSCSVSVSDDRSRCVDQGSIALLAEDDETVIGCMSPAELEAVAE